MIGLDFCSSEHIWDFSWKCDILTYYWPFRYMPRERPRRSAWHFFFPCSAWDIPEFWTRKWWSRRKDNWHNLCSMQWNTATTIDGRLYVEAILYFVAIGGPWDIFITDVGLVNMYYQFTSSFFLFLLWM
jgi:hypothetical protein